MSFTTGLGLGIAGTALGLLNGNGNLLGGLFGGNRNYGNCGCSPADMPITRYEADMLQQLSSKDGKIALLESNIYTDSKIADVYERLNGKISCIESQISQQAVYNATNTSLVSCLQGQVAQLQGLTKVVIPATSICPEVMPKYNSWTAPTTTT